MLCQDRVGDLKKMRTRWGSIRKYVLLYGCFLIYSASAVCAKLASKQDLPLRAVAFLGLEVACLGLYAAIWQQALKQFTLVTAMANKGVVVIFNLIWSVLLFKEAVTINNVIGAAVIIGGIWVVSADG